jgi:hypothetical protein
VRLLQCRPLSRTADRGFHGRPSSYRGPAGSGPDGAQCAGGVVPCPVLFPWSDGRQDLQLGLLLMLISSCSSDVESFGQAGLEAVTQQVGAGWGLGRVVKTGIYLFCGLAAVLGLNVMAECGEKVRTRGCIEDPPCMHPCIFRHCTSLHVLAHRVASLHSRVRP